LDHLKCSSKASNNSQGSSSRKNLFMHENTLSKLAHTSVVGEAPSTVIYVLGSRNLFATSYCNFFKNLKMNDPMNVKCYTFACEVLISSRVGFGKLRHVNFCSIVLGKLPTQF